MLFLERARFYAILFSWVGRLFCQWGELGEWRRRLGED